eukprot:jgi/Mesvir1/1875/Mv22910-RA.1
MSPRKRARKNDDLVLHREVLHPGQCWSHVVEKGQTLRLTDANGGASVAALLFNAHLPVERYNMPDTLKAQYTAFLTTGRTLMSDMGRVLMSITADSCGWHDTLAGHMLESEMEKKYGMATYHELRNAVPRNTRDNFLIELSKYDLGRRDLHANVSFFSKVVVEEDGALTYVPGNSQAGSHVDLRAEMDVLVILSNTPHPMDTTTPYPISPVELTLLQTPPPEADDPCRVSRPECGRAFQKTEPYTPGTTLEAPLSHTPLPTQSDANPPKPLTPEYLARWADASALVDDVVLPGDGWLHQVLKGQTLRIVDMDGNQAADTLLYNAHDPAERYDANLTLRRQGNLYLTKGSVLLSQEGNVLATVVDDNCGRHDTIGGACSCESNQVRYDLRKRHMHACRQTFVLQLVKAAGAMALKGQPPLGKRDVAHNINFFMNVPVTKAGGLKFDDGLSAPGRYVELRAEMDVLVLVSNCPQLNNPCNGWNPTPLRMQVRPAAKTT